RRTPTRDARAARGIVSGAWGHGERAWDVPPFLRWSAIAGAREPHDPDDARLPGDGCPVNDARKGCMYVRWRRLGGGAGWGWNALVPLLVVCLLGVAAAVRHGVDNVHRPDADCLQCHTVDRATLETEHAKARAHLAPDLESRCFTCH